MFTGKPCVDFWVWYMVLDGECGGCWVVTEVVVHADWSNDVVVVAGAGAFVHRV